MPGRIKYVTIIGSGNVAYHYFKIMTEKGLRVQQVSARMDIPMEALMSDLVVIAIKDEFITQLVSRLRIGDDSTLVHTSGFIPSDCLKDSARNYGCLYPLQSLKKNQDTDFFNNVALCICGSNRQIRQDLKGLAKRLSSTVYELSDSQRQCLHIAAVFCNNFTNHLFGIAKQMLEKESIPFSILFPLMESTVHKAENEDPFDSQTGPAARGDMNVILAHLQRLDGDEREIYGVMSEKIMHYHKNKEKE